MPNHELCILVFFQMVKGHQHPEFDWIQKFKGRLRVWSGQDFVFDIFFRIPKKVKGMLEAIPSPTNASSGLLRRLKTFRRVQKQHLKQGWIRGFFLQTCYNASLKCFQGLYHHRSTIPCKNLPKNDCIHPFGSRWRDQLYRVTRPNSYTS